MNQQLYNHVSPETGYIVHNFPYAHGICTPARYWIETRTAFGQRIMYQFLNPETKEWFKPKTRAGYVDICILEVVGDNDPVKRGQVVAHELKLDTFTVDVLLQLSRYYQFTEYQKDRILGALYKKGYSGIPNWRQTPDINPAMHYFKKVESWKAPINPVVQEEEPATLPFKVSGQTVPLRPTGERKYVTIAGEKTDVTGMSEDQIQIMIDLNS